MNTSTVSYFVDTNLFLQCHPLEQLDWTPWDGFEEVRLIVSTPVLREVDYRKNKGSDRVANRARATSAMFRKMLTDGQKVVRAANPHVVLSIEPQHIQSPELEQQLNYEERDDQLVGTLFEFTRCHEGIDVRLLTHDTTPLFTAQGLGLTGNIIPDNWLLPPEPTDAERELLSLRSEVARLKKTEPSFSIRCADQSNADLEHYHASFTWFEPLTDDQVTAFMQRLKAQFPLETDFGSRQPAERAPKQRPGLTVLDAITKEVFTPATDEEIEKYRDEAYPEWLERCELGLRDHHRTLQQQRPPLQFSFLAANVGTHPASDALVTIEAQGHFQIQPPSAAADDEDREGDEDEDRDGEENELEHQKAEELPRPPVAPRGQWKRTIGGHPGDSIRALDVLRRSLYGFPNLEPATARIDHSWLRSLNVRPRSHDPNAFYFKPDRPSSPRSSFSLSCDHWRHDDGEEPFDGTIHVPTDRDKAEGALLFRVQAGNLSKSASKLIPVRIEIAHVSAFESALAMVEKLLESPRFRIDLSSDQTPPDE